MKCGFNSCVCEVLLGLSNIPGITGSINSTDDSSDNSPPPPGNEAQSNTSMNPVPDTLTNEPRGVVGGAWSHGDVENDLVAQWYPQEQPSSIVTLLSPGCASGREQSPSTEEVLAQQTDQTSIENTVPEVDRSRFMPCGIPFVNEVQPPIPIQPASRTLTNEPEGAVGGEGISNNKHKSDFISSWRGLERESESYAHASPRWILLWQRALRLSEEAVSRGYMLFQINIATALYNLERYPQALEAFVKAEVFARQLNDSGFLNTTFIRKAHIYRLLGLPGEALHCNMLVFPYGSTIAENSWHVIKNYIRSFQMQRQQTQCWRHGLANLYFEIDHYWAWFNTLRPVALAGSASMPLSSGGAINAFRHPSLTSESTQSSLTQQAYQAQGESTLRGVERLQLIGYPVRIIVFTLNDALVRTHRLECAGQVSEAMTLLLSLLQSNTLPPTPLQHRLAEICGRLGYFLSALFYYKTVYPPGSVVPLNVSTGIGSLLEFVRPLNELIYRDLLSWRESLTVITYIPTVFQN